MTARVNVRLNDDLYARLVGAAKSRSCPLSCLVRDLLSAELDDNDVSTLEAAEEHITTSLDRFAGDIRRLHTADQALYASFDTFIRLLLTCIPDPPSDSLTAAKMQAQRRYQNYLQNVARNMNGDARAALGELTSRE